MVVSFMLNIEGLEELAGEVSWEEKGNVLLLERAFVLISDLMVLRLVG